MTEEDFLDPFPLFKRKIEREFDAITEQLKRLSIENPDEELCDESDEENLNTTTSQDDSIVSLLRDQDMTRSDSPSDYLYTITTSILAKSLSILILEFVNIL